MSRIITFYSYKGGVGRTFALANVAVLLAQRGHRVLVMDWDLEAPGLHRYFKDHLKGNALRKNGLIHLLDKAAEKKTTRWQPFISTVRLPKGATLSLLASGDQAADYADLVRAFSWPAFFAGHGSDILDRWRAEWKAAYDFVLVDSRTGLTDAGGVCTVFLPDILVLVFAANAQSFERGIQVVQGVQKARRELAVQRPPVAVLPLPGRFDGRDEIAESTKWLDRFARELQPFYDDWLPERFTARQLLEVTKVPYISRFSFGEPLPVLSHSITDSELPGYYLANATRLLETDFQDAALILEPEGPPLVAALRKLLEKPALDVLAIDRAVAAIAADEEIGTSPLFVDVLEEAGTAFSRQRLYDSAENYLRRAMSVAEQEALDYDPDSLSRLYHQLATVLQETFRFAEAEHLMRRALQIDQDSLGPNHPTVAIKLNNLAMLLKATNRLAEAEPLMLRALQIDEDSFGPNHPEVATDLNNLAMLLQDTNRLAEAEQPMRRALQIDEDSFGPNHPSVARDLNNLAQLLQTTNRLAEAEEPMRRALQIDEKSFGPNHPSVAVKLNNLALLLQATNRLAEAEEPMLRALQIDEKSFGPSHPSVARDLNNLAQLLQATNRLAEAEQPMRRALQITEDSFGPNHPTVATALNNLAMLLKKTNRLADAEQPMRRALQIDEDSFGPNHPSVARDLNNLAMLLKDTNRLAEAEQPMRRALLISIRSLGREHTTTQTFGNNYGSLLMKLGQTEAQATAHIQALLSGEAS